MLRSGPTLQPPSQLNYPVSEAVRYGIEKQPMISYNHTTLAFHASQLPLDSNTSSNTFNSFIVLLFNSLTSCQTNSASPASTKLPDMPMSLIHIDCSINPGNFENPLLQTPAVGHASTIVIVPGYPWPTYGVVHAYRSPIFDARIVHQVLTGNT